MESVDRALPLTRGQLDIWLAQEAEGTSNEWQLGLFVTIEGVVDRDALEWAINRVVQEVEPGRATFYEASGQIFQRVLELPSVELPFFDLTESADPAAEATAIASSIRRTPMSLTGPLFKFALFQTGADEYRLFACCHHIVIDGFALGLAGQRIASVYSALVFGSAIPEALFGSLDTLIERELDYEASDDYIADQKYWEANLPADDSGSYPSLEFGIGSDRYSHSASAELDVRVISQVDELSSTWSMPRSSIITAACALLVRGWDDEGTHVVLDFPVSRRIHPELKTLPGMVSGVVPLVLTVSPTSSVTAFCEHVDARIKEALQHQRFPVRELERKVLHSNPGQPVKRVGINFLPSSFTLSFGGATATASYTNVGPVGSFGFVFSTAGDKLLLSTAGATPLAGASAVTLVERLRRVLVAMVADPGRSLSSIDV
ncbi:non-ribosomal peptide synthetase, partial [Mycolicibacterium porcinum]